MYQCGSILQENRFQDVPKTRQDGLRWLQDVPDTALSHPQEVPRRSQDGPAHPKQLPRRAKARPLPGGLDFGASVLGMWQFLVHVWLISGWYFKQIWQHVPKKHQMFRHMYTRFWLVFGGQVGAVLAVFSDQNGLRSSSSGDCHIGILQKPGFQTSHQGMCHWCWKDRWFLRIPPSHTPSEIVYLGTRQNAHGTSYCDFYSLFWCSSFCHDLLNAVSDASVIDWSSPVGTRKY